MNAPLPNGVTRFRRLFAIGMTVLVGGLGIFAFLSVRFRGSGSLVHVSYDATRELFSDVGKKFTERTGVKVTHLHAGSPTQVRALIRGLKADVVSLASASDIDSISNSGLSAKDWRDRFPNKGSPFVSTITFLVRTGNPKAIRDWNDLARDDVSVVCPNPNASGAGKYSYLAAWAYEFRKEAGSQANAERFMRKIYARSPLLDAGSRAALLEFASDAKGDVLLTWESEAWHAIQHYGSNQFEIAYPSASILAEPSVTFLDGYVQERKSQAHARQFLEFLFSDDGQELVARNYLRPRNPKVAEKYAARFPQIVLYSIADVFGSWEAAEKAHFQEGGTFYRIYRAERQIREGTDVP